MKQPLFVSLIIFLLAACTFNSPDVPVTHEPGDPNPPVENPYAPRPGDDALMRGEVYLDLAEILVMESYPVQISLHLAGNLPNPCHELRLVVGEPNSENQIEIEAYSLADPMTICVAMLEPFDINLNLGSFPSGHYIVLVNGEQIGTFDS
ncbi:MAG: hypothetical protein AB1531_11665 [Chloroflexota bacterium]